MRTGGAVEIVVDGVRVAAAAGTTVLEACDAAGVYVPRLCAYPGLTCCAGSGLGGKECGLCAVRIVAGAVVLACRTFVTPGLEIATGDEDVVLLRRQRVAEIMGAHPNVCLTCPDRDGCARTTCTFGHPPEARCCDEFGRCEIGKLYAYLDPRGTLGITAATVSRDSTTEGRIRWEPGLCVGCGRCLTACWYTDRGGNALEMGPDGYPRPTLGTRRASGCTFCGQCVMVCPTGALTAPGEAGTSWLTGRRDRSGLAAAVLPPQPWLRVGPDTVGSVPQRPGVFRLLDESGTVLYIAGVAGLRQGVAAALGDRATSSAAYFDFEEEPLYTQRESELLTAYAQEYGHLPPGNDLGDDVFDEDLFGEDLGDLDLSEEDL